MFKHLLIFLICFYTFEGFSQGSQTIPPGPNGNEVYDPKENARLVANIEAFYLRLEYNRINADVDCKKHMGKDEIQKDFVYLYATFSSLDAVYVKEHSCGETKNGPIVPNLHAPKVLCLFKDPYLQMLLDNIIGSPAYTYYFTHIIEADGGEQMQTYYLDLSTDVKKIEANRK